MKIMDLIDDLIDSAVDLAIEDRVGNPNGLHYEVLEAELKQSRSRVEEALKELCNDNL